MTPSDTEPVVPVHVPARPQTNGRSWWHLRRSTFFVIDWVLLWAVVQLAVRLSPKFIETMPIGWTEIYVLPLFMTLALQLAGVQVNQAGFHGAETLARILVGISAGMGVFVVLHATVGFDLIGRYVLALTLLQGTAFVLVSRWLIWRLAEMESRDVFFIGSEPVYQELQARVRANRLPIRFVGHAVWEPDDSNRPAGREARQKLIDHGVNEIVVENPDALGASDRQILLLLIAVGREITDLDYYYEREFELVRIDGMRESWFWSFNPARARPVFSACKRGTDVALSALGLLLIAPVAAVVAAGIWLQDRGPVLYSQTRIGLHNRPFQIHKFRTMRIDAEPAGPQWAEINDARVTRWGRILRRTRLDELPQLWNILRGEMSIIGPRPERPELITKIALEVPYYPYRHTIKPGLTGWAQVNYHYGASIRDAHEKLAYDFYYIKYGTITRELHIVLRTVVAMIKGAR